MASRRTIQRIPYLLVSDAEHAADLDRVTALLPMCAYGRVFVEVDHAQDQWDLGLPLWMTATWFARLDSAIACGEPRLPGQLVSRAAGAWMNEMMCDQEVINKVRVWLGLEENLSRRVYTYMVGALGMPADHVVRSDIRLPVF